MNREMSYEHQALWLFREYDKVVAENHLLRHYLGQIPTDIVERYNNVVRENKRLNKAVNEQKKVVKQHEKKIYVLKDQIRLLKRQLMSIKEEKSVLSRKVAAYVQMTGKFISTDTETRISGHKNEGLLNFFSGKENVNEGYDNDSD